MSRIHSLLVAVSLSLLPVVALADAPANGILPPGAADKMLPAGATPTPHLIDAGSGSKSELAYAPKKGTSSNVVMAMDMTMAISMGGKPAGPPTTIPTMKMTMSVGVGDKAGADTKILTKLTGVAVDGKPGQEAMVNAMKPMLDGMKGLGIDFVVSGKGYVHDVTMDVPPSVPPQAKQMLDGMSKSFESMVTPFPKEPVGIGARWEVVTRVQSSGVDLVQTATYTLKAHTGNSVTLDMTLVQLAAGDELKIPNMNMTAKLSSFRSAGNGTVTLDTVGVAPTSGSMALKTAMDMTAAGAQTSVETTTNVTMSH